MFFDGGCKNGNLLYSYIIYEDISKKTILFQKSGRCGKGTSNVAEYRALMLGLKKSLELNIKYLEIFGDCQIVINQIKNKFRIRVESLRKMYIIIHSLLSQFDYYELTWIKRYKNRDADQLIRETIRKRWPTQKRNKRRNKR